MIHLERVGENTVRAGHRRIDIWKLLSAAFVQRIYRLQTSIIANLPSVEHLNSLGSENSGWVESSASVELEIFDVGVSVEESWSFG